MFKNATPKKAVAFLRISVAISSFLPRSTRTTKSQVTCDTIIRFMILLNVILFLPPLINSLNDSSDTVNFAFALCLLGMEFKIFVSVIISAVQQDRLQKLMEVMETSLDNAKVYESLVYQRYVDKSSTLYGVSVIWAYLTAVVFVLAPLLSDEPYPLTAKYPFPTDFILLKAILYINQSVIIFEIASHASVTVLSAMLLLFVTARFQILYMELSKVENACELIECVKKYHNLKRYAKEVIIGLQYVALFTVMQCSFGLVFCGIILIQPQSLAVKVQFSIAIANGLLQTFIWAHPADQLLDLSESAMQGIYESKWYEQPTSVQKMVHIMLLPQEPVAISVPCVMPQLSLEYFCSFVTNMFSFFSVLRVTMTADEV